MKNREYKFYSNLFDRLYPIPRSITGDGYRKSLKILKENIKTVLSFKQKFIPKGFICRLIFI